MSIALAIIMGIVAISVVAIGGDIVTTSIKARAKAAAGADPKELEALRERLRLLETRLDDRDAQVRKLEEDLRFVSRLLEDKSGSRA